MPSQVVFDIFALPGVTPNYQHSITAGNAILAANEATIGVTMRVGKVQTLNAKNKGVGTTKNVTGGDPRAGGAYRGAQDWRYSQQQGDILSDLPAGSPRQAEEPSTMNTLTGYLVGGPLLGGAIARMLAPTSGAMPVVWSDGMTQGGRLGEAVNPGVFDETYHGPPGVFMHNGAAAYDAVLLHETLHMCGLQHVADADVSNVMHATMTSTSAQNKLTADQKRTLQTTMF